MKGVSSVKVALTSDPAGGEDGAPARRAGAGAGVAAADDAGIA